MRTLKTFTLLLFVTMSCVSLVIACGDKKTEPSEKPEIISIDNVEDITRFDIENIADSLEVIPLETNEHSIFSRANKIYLYKDRIFLLSTRDQSLIIFDAAGSFIKTISRAGYGPGEFDQLTDFTINTQTDELVVMTNRPNKIMFFTQEGDFLRETKFGDNYFSAIHYSKGYYSILAPHSKPGIEEFRVNITKDLYSNIYDRFLPYKIDTTYTARIGGYTIGHLSSSILFSSCFEDNTIYEIDGNSVKAKYLVDFGKKGLPDNYLNYRMDPEQSMQFLMNMHKSAYYYYIYGIREYDNYLLFYHGKKSHGVTIIDKTTHLGQSPQYFFDHTLKLQYTSIFPHDGADNSIMFLVNSSYLVQLSNLVQFMGEKSEIAKYCRDVKAVKRIENLKETDNPVLFLYKVK